MGRGQTLTYGGSARLERRLAAIVERVGRIVDRATPPGRLRALVLFGGYGRGEGGVAEREGRQQRPRQQRCEVEGSAVGHWPSRSSNAANCESQ